MSTQQSHCDTHAAMRIAALRIALTLTHDREDFSGGSLSASYDMAEAIFAWAKTGERPMEVSPRARIEDEARVREIIREEIAADQKARFAAIMAVPYSPVGKPFEQLSLEREAELARFQLAATYDDIEEFKDLANALVLRSQGRSDPKPSQGFRGYLRATAGRLLTWFGVAPPHPAHGGSDAA